MSTQPNLFNFKSKICDYKFNKYQTGKKIILNWLIGNPKIHKLSNWYAKVAYKNIIKLNLIKITFVINVEKLSIMLEMQLMK